MMNKTAIITILIILLFSPVPSQAVEQAAKITDREIVESLVEIKTTQKMILQRFEQVDKRFEELRTDMNGRFEQNDKRFEELRTDMNGRFEQVDKRFEELRTDMNGRFEELRTDMNGRFEQVDKRFDEMNATNRMFFGFIMSLIITLFGYIIWDRRTMLKPLEEKVIWIEREFDIGVKDGNKITRLIMAFRELSKEDKRVESVLRQFHLL